MKDLKDFVLTLFMLGVILLIVSGTIGCMCAVNIGGDQNVYMNKKTDVYAETDATIPWGL